MGITTAPIAIGATLDASLIAGPECDVDPDFYKALLTVDVASGVFAGLPGVSDPVSFENPGVCIWWNTFIDDPGENPCLLFVGINPVSSTFEQYQIAVQFNTSIVPFADLLATNATVQAPDVNGNIFLLWEFVVNAAAVHDPIGPLTLTTVQGNLTLNLQYVLK
jgi:hypothetical protein